MTDGLVGRAEALDECWRSLTTGSRVASVCGDPGAGKTAVLDALVDRADHRGWRVLRVRGRATERHLPYATLVEVLSARGVDLPEELRAHASDLLAAFAHPRGEDGPRGALELRLDVLDWLLELGASRPLLLVVDDQHWVDASSWSVLSFAANRLGGSTVSALVASRAIARLRGLEEHPLVELGPLTVEQALVLLGSLDVPLDALTRSQVVDRAAGNPLALREFARHADRARTRGPATDAAPVPPRIEATFAADLPDLPQDTRRALLLAAAGGADLAVLGQVLGDGRTGSRLRPAEEAGLVSVIEGRVVFRHPLVRSTVYGQATVEERVAAHEELVPAFADDPVRRTWHRAAAAAGPDDDLAEELAAAAHQALARSAHAEAARAMMRAAELTSSRALREDRMLESVMMLAHSGHLVRLQAVAQRIRDESDDPRVRALAGQRAAYAMAQSMRQAAALDALESSLEELISVQPEAGWASLTTLASLSYQTGRSADRVRVWYDRYRREAEPAPPPYDEVTRAAAAWIETALSPLSRAPAHLALVRDARPLDLELPPDLVVPHEMMLGATAWLLDEPEIATRRLEKSLDLQRRGVAPGQIMQTLMALGQVQFDRAAFGEAAATARAMIDLAEADNLGYYRLVGRELLARVTVITGDARAGREQALAVLREVEVGECASLESNLHVTLGRAAHALGDQAEALRHGRALFDRDGEPMHAHVSYRTLGDLVAAYVRAGQRDAVLPLLDRARSHLESTSSPRFAAILQRSLALVADGDEAEAYYELATSAPAASRWPFELATARLGYGIWLRRQRRPADARVQLADAFEVFDRVGAQKLADAAAQELRAAGGSQPEAASAAPGGWSELTAQERQIVRLAAEGLTNREIGRRLFLSPRTVSTHLYRAFPKLGVSSRNRLRDVVVDLPGEAL